MLQTSMKRSHNAMTTTTAVAAQKISFVEFYCGVGGWTMALQQAVAAISSSEKGGVDEHIKLDCRAALDHSDLCTKVYEFNHNRNQRDSNESNDKDDNQRSNKKNQRKRTPNHPTVAIERLRVDQLVEWSADVWLLSPPCQPHSRQHDNQTKELEDSRSQSFLHLCSLLPQLPPASRPRLLVLENVVGFEASASRRRWMEALQKLSNCSSEDSDGDDDDPSDEYRVAEFHLSPTQLGIPNDRPRYYCLASRQKKVSTQLDRSIKSGKPCWTPADPKAGPVLFTEFPGAVGDDATRSKTSPIPLQKLDHYLDPDIQTCLSASQNAGDDLRIPKSILDRNAAWCFDLVTYGCTRSSCFTSSYGKYVKGTGSIIYTGPHTVQLERPQDRTFDASWQEGLELSSDHLRYFSGMELARLFGFSSTFRFPNDVTRKQQWRLMGNSLNVSVASKLVEWGLRSSSTAE